MRTLQEHISNLNALSRQEGHCGLLDVSTVAEMLLQLHEKIASMQECILVGVKEDRAEYRRRVREESEVRI